MRVACLHPCYHQIQTIIKIIRLEGLQMYSFLHSVECTGQWINKIFFAFQISHHMIQIEWQQGCKQVTQIRLFPFNTTVTALCYFGFSLE